MTRRAGRLLFLLVLIGCGATSRPRGATSDVLTRAEIEMSNASDAYDLLQQLRPQFLRSRGATSIRNPSPAYPLVYMNEMHYGGLGSLRNILVDEIDEVRYISGADATTRWGTGHASGVIQVRAKR